MWEQQGRRGCASCLGAPAAHCTLLPGKNLFSSATGVELCAQSCAELPHSSLSRLVHLVVAKKVQLVNCVRLEPGAAAGGCSRTSTPGRRWEPLPPQTSAAAKSNCCRFGSGFLALWKGQCCRSLQAWCPWKIIGLCNPDSTQRVLVQHREELKESTG